MISRRLKTSSGAQTELQAVKPLEEETKKVGQSKSLAQTTLSLNKTHLPATSANITVAAGNRSAIGLLSNKSTLFHCRRDLLILGERGRLHHEHSLETKRKSIARV